MIPMFDLAAFIRELHVLPDEWTRTLRIDLDETEAGKLHRRLTVWLESLKEQIP